MLSLLHMFLISGSYILSTILVLALYNTQLNPIEKETWLEGDSLTIYDITLLYYVDRLFNFFIFIIAITADVPL